MSVEEFDYRSFVENLASQAERVLQLKRNNFIPLIADYEKKYLVDLIRKLGIMAGESLINDSNIKLSAYQAQLVLQFVCEYVFVLYMTMISSIIPKNYIIKIINTIIGNIFNYSKLALIKGMELDSIISLINEKVGELYSSELEKLLQKKIITKKQFDTSVHSLACHEIMDEYKNLAEEQNNNDTENICNDNTADVSINNFAGSSGRYFEDIFKKGIRCAAFSLVIKSLPVEIKGEVYKAFDENNIKNIEYYKNFSNINSVFNKKVLIRALKELYYLLCSSFFQKEKIRIEKLLIFLSFEVAIAGYSFIGREHALFFDIGGLLFVTGFIFSYIFLCSIKYRVIKIKQMIMKYDKENDKMYSFAYLINYWIEFGKGA